MKMNRLVRFGASAAIIVFTACLVYFAFLKAMPELIPLLQKGSAAEIEQYLRSNDNLSGLMCTVLLQAIQMFSVVLPGMPIQVAAGIVYGTWRSFFVCHLSSVLANVTVFLVVRRLGSRMEQILPVDKKSSRLDFLLNSDNPAYMTIVACLIPILPNGFIPYVAAKTKIKTLHFALAIYCGSFFPVLVLCTVGSKLLKGGYIMSAILIVALCILVFLMIKFKGKVLTGIHKLSEKRLKKGSKRENHAILQIEPNELAMGL